MILKYLKIIQRSIFARILKNLVIIRKRFFFSFLNSNQFYLKDADTRRRAASDLVQALCSQFEQSVVGIFSKYIVALLQEFSTNPLRKWREKDAALFLVTTLASRGQTRKHGTTKASELIDVVQFYESSVLPDLMNQDGK